MGYALAELWASWGVKPSAMIGHSVGEYVAATLAGVMSLEDALAADREARPIDLKDAARLNAGRDESPRKARTFVTEKISIAAINAPGFAVLSGPDTAMEHLEKKLERNTYRRAGCTRRMHFTPA